MSFAGLRARLAAVRREVRAIWLAARDPRTPWFARLLALAIVAYAVSPVDLIPDFIPVLGALDDAIIVPAGLLLARRLIPAIVMADARARAAEVPGRPGATLGLLLTVALWFAGVLLLAALLWRLGVVP